MAKMWAGRFSKEVDEKVNDFNSSISFDCRMYRHDIKGSMAHAKMLGEQGIIAPEESEKIIKGLEGIVHKMLEQVKVLVRVIACQQIHLSEKLE